MKFTILKKQHNNSLEVVLKKMHVPKKEMHWLRMSKNITVNHEPESIRTTVFEGDVINLPDFTIASHYSSSRQYATVTYQDQYLAILKKPHNQKTHPNQTETNTLMNDAMYTLKSDYIEPIHRLDFETNGLVLVALNAYVKKMLDYMISNNEITREYIATVTQIGHLKQGKIEAPIAKVKYKNNYEINNKFGKQAVTHVLDINHHTVTLSLETGRTHQIRLHLASKSSPIIGDKIYGHSNAKNLQLTANRIRFTHPITGKIIDIIDKNNIE